MKRKRHSKPLDKDFLYTEYVILGKSMSKIAKDLSVSDRYIRRSLCFHNVDIRPLTKTHLHRDENWLKDMYLVQLKSMKDIAKEAGVSGETIRIWMKKFGIESRRGSSMHTEIGKKRKSIDTINRWKNNTAFIEKTMSIFNSKEHREQLSKSHLGVKQSEETRKKKSGKNCNFYGKIFPPSYRGSKYTRIDGNIIWLRSSYEVIAAKFLDRLCIDWDYEPIAFPIDDNHTYRPDFYIKDIDIWWEVKGYLSDDSRYRIEQFYIKYPENHLKILWKEDIYKLDQIPTESELYDIINIGQDGL